MSAQAPHTPPPSFSQHDAIRDANRAALRATIRTQLDALAAAIERALRAADLACPVFFSIPSSGEAILSFATPLDPCDEDWRRICAIICGIIHDTTGVDGLCGRDLPCAMAASAIGVAELGVG
jgi:hypothetical protein